MSNLLRDYVALSQFNYIYPFGTLPSNLFFRKPTPLPYYASNEMKNTKISLSKKPTSIEVDMTVDTSVGPAVVDTGNTHVVSSSTKSLVGPYIDTCGDKTSVQYNYKIIAENKLEGDPTTDGHAKVAFDLKNTPLPAAFIKNQSDLKSGLFRKNPWANFSVVTFKQKLFVRLKTYFNKAKVRLAFGK